MIVQAMPYPAAAGTLDPHWANVSFLSGWDNADPTLVVDESSFAHAVSRTGTGSTTSSTAKFGSHSLQKTASAGHYTAADSDAFHFGLDPFTLETFVRFDTAPTAGAHHILAQYEATGNQLSWSLMVNGGSLRLLLSNLGTPASAVIRASVAWAPATGTWYHLAATWDGTTYRMFIDGVLRTTATGGINLHNSTAPVTFGAASSTVGVFVGRLDETRITKGVARYTAAFTPPSEAFPRG